MTDEDDGYLDSVVATYDAGRRRAPAKKQPSLEATAIQVMGDYPWSRWDLRWIARLALHLEAVAGVAPVGERSTWWKQFDHPTLARALELTREEAAEYRRKRFNAKVSTNTCDGCGEKIVWAITREQQRVRMNPETGAQHACPEGARP